MAKKKWGKEEIIGRVEPRNQSRGRGSYGMIDLEPSRRWCDLRPTDCLVVNGWRYGLRLRHSRGGIDAGPVVAVGVRDPFAHATRLALESEAAGELGVALGGLGCHRRRLQNKSYGLEDA